MECKSVQNLDLRSLTFMAGLMGALMGMVILALRRNYPRSIQGLSLWGVAPLLCAGSAVFYGLENWVSPTVVTLGGGVLMGGFVLFLQGSEHFYRQPLTWRRWAVVILAALGLMLWFTRVEPDYRGRLLVISYTLAAIALAHVRLLWRCGWGFAPRFTAAVFLFQAAVLVARGISTLWLDAPDTDRYTPSTAQVIYVAAYSFTVLLASMGVLLMAAERVRTEFEHLALHDGLTGVLTRRAVLEHAREEMARWQRYHQPLSVLMLDMDHFKRINDAHGHLVGDGVLRGLAGRVRAVLRETDFLGRYGGEEFVVLMPATDLSAAQLVAERIRAAVAEEPLLQGAPLCTVSLGVATATFADPSFDALLARADRALYRAKAGGRNQVAVGDVGAEQAGESA